MEPTGNQASGRNQNLLLVSLWRLPYSVLPALAHGTAPTLWGPPGRDSSTLSGHVSDPDTHSWEEESDCLSLDLIMTSGHKSRVTERNHGNQRSHPSLGNAEENSVAEHHGNETVRSNKVNVHGATQSLYGGGGKARNGMSSRSELLQPERTGGSRASS